MPKLQFQNGRWSLTIPHEQVKAKGWKKGQLLLVGYNEKGNLEVSEIKE